MFVELRPDYLPISYTADSWGAVLRQLRQAPSKKTLCLTDEGFATAGKIYVLWQKIKEWLGFTNLTCSTRVGAALIKFFFQGVAHGFIEKYKEEIESVKNKIDTGRLKVHEAVKKVFIHLGTLEEVRKDLEEFYQEHSSQLEPAFWSRLAAKEISVSKDFYFGEAHLALAEAQTWEEPDLAFENLHRAAQLYNTEKLTERLCQSFKTLAAWHPPKTVEEKSIYPLLGEKKYQAGHFPEAYDYFSSVLRDSLSPRQKVLFLISAAECSEWKVAETLSAKVVPDSVDKVLREPYIEVMTDLGDHYAAKNGTITTRVLYAISTIASYVAPVKPTPTSEEHCLKAFQFYQKAHALALKNSSEILEKILKVAQHLPEDHLIRVQSESYVKEWQEDYLLIAMKGKNLLESPERRGTILQFTRAIFKRYADSSKNCLQWIEEALQCIGPVKERLYVVHTGYFLNSKPDKIGSGLKGLLTEEGQFAFDVGAGLHFLKAEILRKQEGDTERVLEAYQLATHLAPKNPFGAASLFLEERQQVHFLRDEINTYRNMALTWGANSY